MPGLGPCSVQLRPGLHLGRDDIGDRFRPPEGVGVERLYRPGVIHRNRRLGSSFDSRQRTTADPGGSFDPPQGHSMLAQCVEPLGGFPTW